MNQWSRFTFNLDLFVFDSHLISAAVDTECLNVSTRIAFYTKGVASVFSLLF